MAKGNPRRVQRQNRTRERRGVTKLKWRRADGINEYASASLNMILVKITETTEARFSTHDARARSKSKRRRARKERRTAHIE